MAKLVVTDEPSVVIDREGLTPTGTLIVCRTNNPNAFDRGLYWRVVKVAKTGVDDIGQFATKQSALDYAEKVVEPEVIRIFGIEFTPSDDIEADDNVYTSDLVLWDWVEVYYQRLGDAFQVGIRTGLRGLGLAGTGPHLKAAVHDLERHIEGILNLCLQLVNTKPEKFNETQVYLERIVKLRATVQEQIETEQKWEFEVYWRHLS